jgi:hypothetical protein
VPCNEQNSNGLPARGDPRFDELMRKRSSRRPGPQPDCGACIQRRVHTQAEEDLFHPYAKEGCTDGHWSKPELKQFSGERIAREKAATLARKDSAK